MLGKSQAHRTPAIRQFGVWGTDPNNVWTVGSGGSILHWDGAQWSCFATESQSNLTGIWGIAADDIWASGADGVILHWDGVTWSQVPSGTSAGVGVRWGTATDDVWATVVIPGTLLHWDGLSWNPIDTGFPDYFVTTWGTGPDNIWAGGPWDYVAHWDGKNWSRVDLPVGYANNLNPVSAIWGADANNVFFGASSLYMDVGFLIYHWDGNQITVAREDGFYFGTQIKQIRDIWGRAADDIWVDVPIDTHTGIMHWDGSAWSLVATPRVRAYTIWPTATDVWVAGDDGAILHTAR